MNRREFITLLLRAAAAPIATGVVEKIAPLLALPEARMTATEVLARQQAFVVYMVQLSAQARNGQTLEQWVLVDKAIALLSHDPAAYIAREVEMARIGMSNHPQFDPYSPVTVTDFEERLYLPHVDAK